MEAYKAWVRQNRQLITSLEGIANTLTWMLPERFTSSEVGAESVAALLGVMAVVNQHIIDTAPPESNHIYARNGMHASINRDLGGNIFPFFLSIVKELEVLIEVMAEHYQGTDRKWNVLSAVEAIKAGLRFLILHQTGYRVLLHAGEELRKEDSLITFRRGFSTGQTNIPFPNQSRSYGVSGTQSFERRASLALMKFGENVGGVNSQPSWMTQYQNNPATLNGPPCIAQSIPLNCWEFPDGLSVAGECLFILRPLLYVLLIKRYGIKSWKPLVTSFAFEMTSLFATLWAESLKGRAYLTSGSQYEGAIPTLCVNEAQELRRRRLLLILYLLRDPFFSKFTRHPLENAQQALRPVPVLGFIGEKLTEFLTGIQTRYCYTSGS